MELDRDYSGHGISFRYPAAWELSEERREDAATISVSDDGPFWSVTILQRRPRTEDVLNEAVRAFRDEYEELDEYPQNGTIGGEPAEGCNLEFVSLELINCVSLRAQVAGGRTLFVMAQVTDHERQAYEEVFQAISNTLQAAPDEEILIN
jgi:hypothetical protein